jgi:hypothetical protein
MRDYTTKEKAKIPAGAVTSLVIVGWLVVLALALLSVRQRGRHLRRPLVLYGSTGLSHEVQ